MSKRPKLVKIVDPLKLWNPGKTPGIPVADNIVRCACGCGNKIEIGDKVKGEGFIRFQDGFSIDRSPVVTVREYKGMLYCGSLSIKSFPKIWITDKHKPVLKWKWQDEEHSTLVSNTEIGRYEIDLCDPDGSEVYCNFIPHKNEASDNVCLSEPIKKAKRLANEHYNYIKKL